MVHQDEFNNEEMSQEASLGELLFRWRDYTPLPLVVIMLFVAKPTALSATLGTLLIVAGELLRIYAVAFIGGISRTRKGSLGGDLVEEGPFKWVRNPLYCGNFIIVCGVAIFTSLLWFFLLAVIGFALQYYYIVAYEEKLLSDRFGEEFASYKKRVPAWLPKRMPKGEDIDWPESFNAAFLSEKRTLLAIVGVLILLLLKA